MFVKKWIVSVLIKIVFIVLNLYALTRVSTNANPLECPAASDHYARLRTMTMTTITTAVTNFRQLNSAQRWSMRIVDRPYTHTYIKQALKWWCYNEEKNEKRRESKNVTNGYKMWTELYTCAVHLQWVSMATRVMW